MLKLKNSKAIIESNHKGYCYIQLRDENESWLEIHGNQDSAEYPLILESEEDIDEFCLMLKRLLKQIKTD